ncbi:MAG: hypothetical protein U0263_15315 [Polyangiaceae bacterium]
MSTPALAIRALRKHYGRTVALDGLDLEIPKGVISASSAPTAPARPPPSASSAA